MNDLFQVLTEKLKTAGFGSKAVAALVGVAMILAIGVTAVVSKRPHYELAFSGLSDHEVARVNKALSEVGLAFEVSQPPAPFSVFVDRADRSAAYRAVYGAGALDKPLKGILSESGISSVFQGSEERLQSVRKREWQEMEGMLEVLDFIVSARVRTSPGRSSPISGPTVATIGASVTLRLVGAQLTSEQSETVAQLVSVGLGIPKDKVVISDQAGKQLYGGSSQDEMDRKVGDLLDHRERHDEQAMQAANAVLTDILGPGKARITVRSEWDFDQSTVRTESASGKGTLISEQKNSTETPINPNANGREGAGIASNVAEGEPTGTPSRPANAEPLVAKTSQEDRQYKPAMKTEERVRFMPALTRLSVAVFLDESLDANLTTQLEEAIKAAVGFVEARDEFRSVSLPFVSLEEPATEVAPVEPPAEPNRMMEVLLERGVEIGVSLVFVFLLLKSLKGGSKVALQSGRESAREPELDPELLARAKVEELLKADPEQVGSILSSWARSEDSSGVKV